MLSLTSLQRAALAAAILSFVGATTPDALSPADVMKSLQTIQHEADAVASGKTKNGSELRDSARRIGVEWQKVEPTLAKDFLVETRFANQSVTAFERDWKTPNLVRSDAKDLNGKIADLLDAQQKAVQSATPAPATSPPSSR